MGSETYHSSIPARPVRPFHHDLDMHDYILLQDEPLPDHAAEESQTDRTKAEEKAELRKWWARLDEDKKQEIRETKYWESPSTKKPEKPNLNKPKRKRKDQKYDRSISFCYRDLIC